MPIGTTRYDFPEFSTTGTTKMGSIVERSRKDGSKAFVAQIVIKKAGTIAHREAQSFDRKQAANAWIVKREAELKKPGGLEQKENPPFQMLSIV